MRVILRDVLEGLAALLGAFVLFALAGRAGASAVLVLDPFGLAVVLFAMEKGEVPGAFLGTACGLVQDAFASGVFGVAGFSKTVLGIAAGYASRKLNVRAPLRGFVFVFACAAGELLIWAVLYGLVFSRGLSGAAPLLLFRPVVTAALGSGVLLLARRLRAREATPR